MKTVKISKNTRVALGNIRMDEESIDMIVNRLLDTVCDDLDSDFTVGYININLNEDTMERIKSFKAYPTETYEHILLRALNLYMGSNHR